MGYHGDLAILDSDSSEPCSKGTGTEKDVVTGNSQPNHCKGYHDWDMGINNIERDRWGTDNFLLGLQDFDDFRKKFSGIEGGAGFANS